MQIRPSLTNKHHPGHVLSIEDEQALSMLRRANWPSDDRPRYTRAVSALGTDLYDLAYELAASPDDTETDDEWLTPALMMQTEAELLRRIGGWENVQAYVWALLAGRKG